MGRYIEWDDVLNRYEALDSLADANMGSAYIAYGEALVEGALAPFYTVPFSDNNITVRDLAIDATFIKAGRLRDEDVTEIRSDFWSRIEMLRNGEMVMMTGSGSLLTKDNELGAWSNTRSYHTSFGLDDPINWHPSSSHLEDLEDARDD